MNGVNGIGPDALAATRAALLTDEALQAALQGAPDTATLADLLTRHLAGTASTDDWSAWLARAAALPAGPPEWTLVDAPPRQWLPVQVYGDGTHLYVEWLHFAFTPLAEPFFEQTAARVRNLPLNLLLRCSTRLEALVPLAALPQPNGLVFHMSRCGSTLVGQMLDALGSVTVVSEPPPLDIAIRLWLDGHVGPDIVRAMAGALVRDRGTGAAHRAIKMDAWHTLRLPTIATLFPEARLLFLFRDPIEVMVSQLRSPGMHARRGEVQFATFGLHGADNVTDADFVPWVIAATARAGLEAARLPGLRLVDYAALPRAFADTIVPHLGIALPPDRAAALAQVGQRHSKDATRSFTEDSADKQNAASLDLRARAAARGLPALHDKLVRAAAAPTRQP